MSEHSLASLLAWFWCSHAVTLILSVVRACGVDQVVLQLGTVERAASLYFELQDLIRQAHTNILADKPPQVVRHTPSHRLPFDPGRSDRAEIRSM